MFNKQRECIVSGKRYVYSLFLCLSVVVTGMLLPGNRACAAEDKTDLVVLMPAVQEERVMKDMADAFEKQHEDIKVEYVRRNVPARQWLAATESVATGNTDLMFTSQEDWTYRSTETNREKLRYEPVTQQIVYRADKAVGSVEYGMLAPRQNVSDAAKKFLDFIESPEAHAVLEQPDPYHFVPLDREVKAFEAPEWFDPAPWKGPKPSMWHGVCQIRGGTYFTTILAELKKVWMAGFNQVQGTELNERIYAWAEEHGMVLTGLPSLMDRQERRENWKEFRHESGIEENFIDRVRKAVDIPVSRGLYASNEDFINRIIDDLFTNVQHRKTGKTEDKVEGVEAVEEQFPRWLHDKHGDIETLNERWGASYESWDEIGFPELPLDWVQKIYESTGKSEGDLSTDELIFTLFHQPLHFHALADHPALLDFQRYMREAWARNYKALSGAHQLWDDEYKNHAEQLKPIIEDNKFYYTTKTRLNPYLFREVEAFNAAGHTHMICGVPPHYNQVVVDTEQIARGHPLWNAEDHLYNHASSTPRLVRYFLLQKYLMGMFKSSSYNRTTNFMAGRPDPGPYAPAKRSAHYKAEVKTRNQIRRHEPVFRAFLEARSDADIAVLVTEGNRGWNTLPDAPGRPEMGGVVKAYGHVGALGRPWKYVLNRDVSAEHCTGTLIVDAPWLTRETAKKITNLPDDRRIIAVGEIPAQDEYGQRLPGDVLEELETRVTVIDGWDKLNEEVEQAEGLSGPYTQVSDGTFWFWGRVAGTTTFSMPAPKLELRRVRHEGNLYLAITNHSAGMEVTAKLPWAGGKKVRELTADDPTERIYPHGKYLRFSPYSVRLFEITETE